MRDMAPRKIILAQARADFTSLSGVGGVATSKTDRVAALIAWMLVVRVGDVVKDRRPPKAAALCAVLDNITNTNRNAVQAIKAAF
jgi:hypothetical protein